jgi:HD-like signal output (HDOD) protein
MTKLRGLHGWIRLLEGNQAAVLSSLLKELDRITSDDESSAHQLAETILKDARLTSHIIRIGNSIQFNPGTVPVTTVSRAIVNIGFKHIRSVCMSIKILETVLEGAPSKLLLQQIATTLHAAFQTRNLCKHMKENEQEEVFVASLLSHLTELLVLASDKSDAKDYAKRLTFSTTLRERIVASEETLGVSIKTLSKMLLKRWRIDGLVNLIYEPGRLDERLDAIALGDEIALSALEGSHHRAFKSSVSKAAKLKDQSIETMENEVTRCAQETSEALAQFGHSDLKNLIPLTGIDELEIDVSQVADELNQVKLMNADFQLEALQALTQQIIDGAQLGTFFKTMLSGLHEGVGLERVAFLINDRANKQMRTKSVVGQGTEKWAENFCLAFENTPSTFLYQLFEFDEPCWVGGDKFKKLSAAVGDDFKMVNAASTFFIAPLRARGKVIGLMYADMDQNPGALDKDRFKGFKQFCLQGRLALEVLASK